MPAYPLPQWNHDHGRQVVHDQPCAQSSAERARGRDFHSTFARPAQFEERHLSSGLGIPTDFERRNVVVHMRSGNHPTHSDALGREQKGRSVPEHKGGIFGEANAGVNPVLIQVSRFFSSELRAFDGVTHPIFTKQSA